MINSKGILYIIENNEEGLSQVTEKKSMYYEKLDLTGWQVNHVRKSNMDIKIYRIEPNSIYESHSAPVDLICIVTQGFGELFLTDDKGNTTEVINCKKGDIYFQGANTLHGFRSGTEVTVLTYIENLSNSK